jgi:hypothetical protein
MDEMGSERPAKARASSVLEMAPMIGAATAVACDIITFPASRASSLLVGTGFAWATLPHRSRSGSPLIPPLMRLVMVRSSPRRPTRCGGGRDDGQLKGFLR